MNQSTKRLLSFGSNTLVLTLTIAGILAIFYLVIDRELRFRSDWTSSGTHSLSPKTLKLLGRLSDDSIKVHTHYFQFPLDSEKGRDALFSNQKVSDLLSEYNIRSKRHFTYDINNPYQEPLLAKEYAAGPGTAVLFRKDSPDLRQVIKYPQLVKKRSASGATPQFMGEQTFTTALSRLIDKTRRTACFLVGHDELSIESETNEGLSRVRELLETENYSTQTIHLVDNNPLPVDLSTNDAGPHGVLKVPGLCNVLVVPGPKLPMAGEEIQAIFDYFLDGGSLILMADPFTKSNLHTLTKQLGVDLLPGVVIDSRALRSPVNPVPEYVYHEITKDLLEKKVRAVMRQAVALRAIPDATAPFNQKPLLFSSDESKIMTDVKNSSGGSHNPQDLLGRKPLAMAIAPKNAPLTNGKNPILPSHGRAVVVGDSDIIRNDWINAPANADLFLNAVHWCVGEEEKITITPKDPDIRTLDITDMEGYVVLAFIGGIFPGLIVLVGGLIWRRRRRKT